MPMTTEQIRARGLAALREALGRAGMVRFLQQFEQGSGDYTRDRRKWVDQTSLEEIVREAKRTRRRPSGSNRRG
jgi:hypothetical protein